jgi:hypothetical protein
MSPLIDKLIAVVRQIDQHLAQHSVPPEQQLKPHPALQTPSPFNAQKGQSFTLKLKDFGNVHELKPAEIDNPDLIFQAATGTQAGEYEFFAMDAGTTKVKLIVAHDASLAVVYREVVVVVAEWWNPRALMRHYTTSGLSRLRCCS